MRSVALVTLAALLTSAQAHAQRPATRRPGAPTQAAGDQRAVLANSTTLSVHLGLANLEQLQGYDQVSARALRQRFIGAR